MRGGGAPWASNSRRNSTSRSQAKPSSPLRHGPTFWIALSPPAFLIARNMKRVVSSTSAPAAVGPYSQAVAFGDFLFCAGQIPLDPATSELVPGGVTEQTTRVCENIAAVLAANGMTFADVIKSTVFLVDLKEFAAMNAVYTQYFPEPFPARSTIQVAALPRASQVEIEVVAARSPA
jgi:2-iminobutanoate/2-iminopropanoate deaminase